MMNNTKKNKLQNFLSTHGLILIIILALIYRMVFFISLQPWDEDAVRESVIVGDALEYHPMALSILSTKSFEAVTAYRTPGYPLFVALLYSISSSSVWFVLLVQILLSLVSVFLIYKIAALFLSRKIALLSAFLFAIDTTQAVWTVQLYTETLFVFLFLLSVYYLCRYIKEGKLPSILLSSLFLGMATLVRPVAYMFPVVAVIVIFLLRNLTLKKKFIQSAVFILIFLLTVSPWLLHNYFKYGEAKLSSISGFNLLYWNVAYTEAYKTGRTIDEVRKDLNVLASEKGADTINVNTLWGADTINVHTFRNSEIYSGIARNYIRDNLFLYARRHLMGIINMYAGLGTQKISILLNLKTEITPSEAFGGPGIFTRIINFIKGKSTAILIIAALLGLYLLVNYLFSLYGIYVLWKQKEVIILIFFILIVLYFSVLTGVIGYDRYRISFMPFINILCASGLVQLYDNIRKVRRE